MKTISLPALCALITCACSPLHAAPDTPAPLAPASVANAYNRALVTEVAALKPRLLIFDDPDAALKTFQFNSVQGTATGAIVAAQGPGFAQAWRITTERKPQEWMTHLQSFTRAPIHAGDMLYVTAWVRAIQVTDGKPQGMGRLYASEERGGNQHDSASLYAGDFAIPQTWTRVHFGMTATRDHGADDELKLMFTFGHTGQTIEFGGLAALDFGPGVDKAALPHAALPLNYVGREPGAAWRVAALQRIEKIRKADFQVRLTDATGKAIPNAQVRVTMTRHAFGWGSSFPLGMLPAAYQQIKPWNADFARTAGAPDADKQRAQQEFLRLFNCATTSVTWALWSGADARIVQSDLLGGLRWFQEHHIPVYNSQAVYPSPEFTAPQVVKTLLTPAKKPEFAAALRDFVTLSATKLYPAVQSLQIANEIEGRPQYTDVLGRDAVPNWFRWVKAANPRMMTEINGPYGLGAATVQTANRPAGWPTSEGLQYYYDLIAHLRQAGAPIDAIGFQNHLGLGAAAPQDALKTLDAFATFGKPLEVTEYEMTLQDGTDAQQRAYQADYTRDFLIAVFSHPQVERVILQDFWQPAAWQAEGASAFFNADWSANPHERAYEKLVLNDWWTRLNGQTDARGVYAGRGFLGDYEVTVTVRGKTKVVPFMIRKGNTALTVTFN